MRVEASYVNVVLRIGIPVLTIMTTISASSPLRAHEGLWIISELGDKANQKIKSKWLFGGWPKLENGKSKLHFSPRLINGNCRSCRQYHQRSPWICYELNRSPRKSVEKVVSNNSRCICPDYPVSGLLLNTLILNTLIFKDQGESRPNINVACHFNITP